MYMSINSTTAIHVPSVVAMLLMDPHEVMDEGVNEFPLGGDDPDCGDHTHIPLSRLSTGMGAGDEGMRGVSVCCCCSQQLALYCTQNRRSIHTHMHVKQDLHSF